MVKIPKVSFGDVVVLTDKIAKKLGGIPNIMYCYKISSNINLVDPHSGRTVDLKA